MINFKKTKLGYCAYYFIYLAQSKSQEITNKKIQKLLYYAQAWSLVLNNKILFRNKIEAWVHGPAIPEVYKEFKTFGFKNINLPVEDDLIKLSDSERRLLRAIWSVYGKHSAGYLEALTHSEYPWREARKDSLPFEQSSNIISTEIMKVYYRDKYEKLKKEA